MPCLMPAGVREILISQDSKVLFINSTKTEELLYIHRMATLPFFKVITVFIICMRNSMPMIDKPSDQEV